MTSISRDSRSEWDYLDGAPRARRRRVLQAEGPRGGFVCRPADRDTPTLFVATGSGLAPLRATLKALEALEARVRESALKGYRLLAVA